MSLRIHRFVVSLISVTLSFLAFTHPAYATDIIGGGSPPSSGGLSGGGSGGSSSLTPNGCGGPNGFVVVYNEHGANGSGGQWGPVPSAGGSYPNGAALQNFLYPAAVPLHDMAFKIIPTGGRAGYAYGPSALSRGWDPSTSTGVPAGWSSFGAWITALGGGSGGWDNNYPVPDYLPSWACYSGNPAYAGFAPINVSWPLTRPPALTQTDFTTAALVGDNITASLKNCSRLVQGPGINPTKGPSLPASTWRINSPLGVLLNQPGQPVLTPGDSCPNAGTDYRDNTDWQWNLHEEPVESAQPSCGSGSGSFKWDWKPYSFTSRNNFCTGGPTDNPVYWHVLDNPPGLSVRVAVHWQYYCWGNIFFKPGNETQSFGTYTSITLTFAAALPNPTIPTVTVNCDGQFNTTSPFTAPIPIQQIESLAK